MEIKIADIIKRKRIENVLTQEKLAEELGVTKAAVSKWELGQSIPDVILIPSIADYFGITIDELFGHEAKNSPPKKITVRYDAGIGSWNELTDHMIFDHAEIDMVRVNKIGNYNEINDKWDYDYAVTVLFHSEEEDFLEKLQAVVADGVYIDTVSKKLENGKEMPNEPIYHHWVCKHKIYTFRVGDRKATKAYTKELISLGIMNEDDLY